MLKLKSYLLLPLIIPLLSLLTACAPVQPRAAVPVGTVPIAKAPSAQDEQYGHGLLTEFRQKWQLANNHPRLDEVDEIVARLTRAARADTYPWHVYVFEDPEFKNAAATRGNHVFVWTAMLDATKSKSELATVLAHEVAHVLAAHVEPDQNEQMKEVLISLGAAAAGIAVARSSGSYQTGQNLGNITSSLTQEIGSGIFLNPYSREKEYEADQVGLFLMADAGFNPSAALDFWKRAQNDPSFSSSLEFFSTHPPAAGRQAKIESYLPMAMERYRRARR